MSRTATFRHTSATSCLAVALVAAIAATARAGDLVDSGFEPGQTWAGTSYVVAASWPDAFHGSYALHVKDSLQYKTWPPSGTTSQTYLSIRVHFRVQSDTMDPDPDHDGAPYQQVSLMEVVPKNSAGKRPEIALKRDDDRLVLRIADYSRYDFVYDAVVVPDRWHVMDWVLDQTNHRMTVALDGTTVWDNLAADVGTTPFTSVHVGITYADKNGNSIWFDDVRIRDSGGLQGPELVASATATPGVGAAPLTTNFALSTAVSNPTVEWDFDGDGVIDATGASAATTYTTSGLFKPVARVTSGTNRAAVYPPIVHATAANAPTVVVTNVRGGLSTLAFPRLYDLSADVTAASGAKTVKVEWDWNGGGVYAWNGRTPWSSTGTITVRTPHQYPFDFTTAVVRAKATDDSGRVGVGELALTLPPALGTPTPIARDSRAGIYTTYGWAEVYDNRGKQLPSWVAGADVGAYLDWKRIETSDNYFDFGSTSGANPYTYNGRIAQIVNSGKNVVLQCQDPWPDWLFTKVGKSVKVNAYGRNYPQFWDPRYLYYLNRFVQAQASNVQTLLNLHPTWAGHFVVNRGQSLTIDMELLPTGKMPVYAYPNTAYSMALTAANFTPPASGAYSVDFTPELCTVYASTVRSDYEAAFGALGIPSFYKPLGGGYYNGWDQPRADDELRKAVANSQQGFFVTNARSETGQDHWFLGFTDLALAHGFHEEAGNDPSANNATVQSQYWTLLSELNCGSEFVGCYGDYAYFLEYQSEYENEPIYSFVNRHVGWKGHAAQSPAAFLTLKQPTTPPNETFTTGNYAALLTEVADDGSDVASQGSVHYTYTGPGYLVHPAYLDEAMKWARSCPAGGQLRFDVDDTYRNAHGNWWDLEVVYLDSYQGQFFVRYKNQRGILRYVVVPMTGDGRWHRAIASLQGATLRNDVAPGADFALEADTLPTVFHRIVLTPH